MPYYAHPDTLDHGLAHITSNTDQVALVHNFSISDSYATVFGNRIAAYASVVGDFTLGSQGEDRRVTTENRTVTAFASTPAEFLLHVVCLDTVSSRVLLAMESAVNETVVSGGSVDIPAFAHTARQPVVHI